MAKHRLFDVKHKRKYHTRIDVEKNNIYYQFYGSINIPLVDGHPYTIFNTPFDKSFKIWEEP